MILNYLLKHQMLFDSPPTINNQELSFNHYYILPVSIFQQAFNTLDKKHYFKKEYILSNL